MDSHDFPSDGAMLIAFRSLFSLDSLRPNYLSTRFSTSSSKAIASLFHRAFLLFQIQSQNRPIIRTQKSDVPHVHIYSRHRQNFSSAKYIHTGNGGLIRNLKRSFFLFFFRAGEDNNCIAMLAEFIWGGGWEGLIYTTMTENSFSSTASTVFDLSFVLLWSCLVHVPVLRILSRSLAAVVQTVARNYSKVIIIIRSRTSLVRFYTVW